MDSRLYEELKQTAIQALHAIPKRGLEIGGLLYGQVRRERDVEIFEATAFEEVASEHRFGPSYALDEADRLALAAALGKCRREAMPPVVGFFRTYTGREARLDDTDRELLQSFFQGKRVVCLLLKPLSYWRCDAAIEFWSGGTDVPAEPQPLPAAESQPSFGEVSGSGRRSQALAALCFLLAALAGAVGYWLWNRPQTPPPVAQAITKPPIATPAPVATPAAPAAQVTPPEPAPLTVSHPPVVRREARAAISSGILRRLRAPLTVPVAVAVDAKGRVVHAGADTIGSDGLERYLIAEAVKCARHWTFAPARSSDGHPVPGTATVTIEFSPVK